VTGRGKLRGQAGVSALGAALAFSGVLGCAKTTSTEAVGPDGNKIDTVLLRKQLAVSLADHREWAAAVRVLVELGQQRPKDSEIQALLGTVYREQGLFEQAGASYDYAIRLDPRNAEAYAGRGILREVRGEKSDAALDDFRSAMRLRPADGAYANNLGFALTVRGRYSEAAAALQEGLEHDPLSRRMRNNLGFVYGRLHDFARAKREFEHGGTSDEVENNLGFVYEQSGDSGAACNHYREALVENPQLEVASENIRRVCKDAKSGPVADHASDMQQHIAEWRSPW
jgi:Flp pilus assembly protein TadD